MASKKTLTISFLDGRPDIEVTPTLQDTLEFENVLKKNRKWGGLKENALKMQPFRAFNAARRVGLYSGSWDEFVSEVTDVVTPDPDDIDQDSDTEVGGLGEDTTTAASPSY
ncbi:hypothetical protein HQQ81_05630 [Microbacteriaceae bacterium VKM Ac-2854]|nr:hypothetical protein [Microbacteriaceae bacterium VKM Ac-2854]